MLAEGNNLAGKLHLEDKEIGNTHSATFGEWWQGSVTSAAERTKLSGPARKR